MTIPVARAIAQVPSLIVVCAFVFTVMKVTGFL